METAAIHKITHLTHEKDCRIFSIPFLPFSNIKTKIHKIFKEDETLFVHFMQLMALIPSPSKESDSQMYRLKNLRSHCVTQKYAMDFSFELNHGGRMCGRVVYRDLSTDEVLPIFEILTMRQGKIVSNAIVQIGCINNQDDLYREITVFTRQSLQLQVHILKAHCFGLQSLLWVEALPYCSDVELEKLLRRLRDDSELNHHAYEINRSTLAYACSCNADYFLNYLHNIQQQSHEFLSEGTVDTPVIECQRCGKEYRFKYESSLDSFVAVSDT